MTVKPFVLILAVLAALPLTQVIRAQEVDGSDLRRDVRERDERINKLSTEDQLKLRAAQQKAAEDPVVKAALEKRNKAVQEFREAVRASMIKSDPAVAPLLEKVEINAAGASAKPR